MILCSKSLFRHLFNLHSFLLSRAAVGFGPPRRNNVLGTFSFGSFIYVPVGRGLEEEKEKLHFSTCNILGLPSPRSYYVDVNASFLFLAT